MPSISCSDLTFRWPDGTEVLRGLDLALGPGRTGVVGRNGDGKTTLLRLIAGVLKPSGGTVRTDGSVGYLPQDLPLLGTARVDEVLGIADVVAAIADVEAGVVDQDHLDRIGDDWDIAERAQATLDRLGLGHVNLDRTVTTLSGGEAILLGMAARFLADPDVLLLDEPTNNLDAARREALYEAIDRFEGVLLVVSHDRALLDRVERIVEVRDGSARLYGGNLSAYEDAVAAEQEAAQQAVRTAKADLRRQERDRIEAQTVIDRRSRLGRKQQLEGRFPKIVAGQRKRSAQVSAGKVRGTHEARIAGARERLDSAAAAVRDAETVRVDLPETAVSSRRMVLRCHAVQVAPAGTALWGEPVDLVVRGPERIALLGPNGAGKSTLLRCLVGELAPAAGTVEVTVPGVGYLPQRLDVLDAERTVLENVRARAVGVDTHTVRARLARFGFRGDAASQPATTLSGGERFRAVLATLLCAEPPPQLLILDEPTNNLDLHTVGQLRLALDGYRGAVVLASHDTRFLEAVGITRWLHLDHRGLRDLPR